ncbi:ISAs1 family transposase [Treponema pedis]|uniref:ISAs1 family transposase n=1 Tax=Treponema pedis TaxID=409322 RepID=UPI000570D066|nr:ISAs1 family transposase [Treponema pedis]
MAGEKSVTQKLIHIDGKTIRGNARRNEKPVHIVSAYCSDDGFTIGQTATEEKSNEITAIPKLLKMINVKGNIITIDAMGTQKAIAETIKKRM